MDQQRFDDALRALHAGATTTRRAGLAAALGVLLGGAATGEARGGNNRGGRRRGKRHRADDPRVEGPCGDGSSDDNRCTNNRDCCTKYCADGACRCKPNWMDCNKDEHCCSERCLGGRCDGGAKPEGSACAENFNCKEGLACIDGVCAVSDKAKCTRRNCPGCCDGTTCRIGASIQACGAAGDLCASCAADATCSAGICQAGGAGGCNPATCPTGCCSGDTCVAAAAQGNLGCGIGGVACAECSGGTPICDQGTCRSEWDYSTQFGSSGTGDSNLDGPVGVAISEDTLTAWVADSYNDRIVVWTRPDATSTSWSYSTQIKTWPGNGYLTWPSLVAVSADSLTIWVYDSGGFRLVVFTRPDATSTSWSFSCEIASSPGTGDNNFRPNGIAVSPDTLTIWMADAQNSRIVIWTRLDANATSWSYSAQFGTQGSGDSNLDYPACVAISDDTLTAWIGDNGNKRVTIWTRLDTTSTTWNYSTQFGSQGTGDSNFGSTGSIAVSSDTLTVWIVDSTNSRVAIWTRQDTTSTTWTYSTQFGAPGAGASAVGMPYEIAVSPDGLSAWVTDFTSDRVSIWKNG